MILSKNSSYTFYYKKNRKPIVQYPQKPNIAAGHLLEGTDLTSWCLRGNSNYTFMPLILYTSNINRYIYVADGWADNW